PASVQSIVLERLDRLAPAPRAALQAASVLGQRFDLAALAQLLDGAFDPAPLVAQALVRCEGDEGVFVHGLIRDAVYASMLRSRRRELHERAAAWFAGRDAALHAEHLAAAENPRAAAAYLDA